MVILCIHGIQELPWHSHSQQTRLLAAQSSSACGTVLLAITWGAMWASKGVKLNRCSA
jgi:hypothetical protein